MALFQKSVLQQHLKTIDKNLVSDAYKQFVKHFHNATIQQHIRESKEEQYQGEFLIDLFVNVLGYTKNPQPNFNLQTEQKNETDSKKADGAILKNGNAIAVIELKGTNTTDLNKVTQQAFGYKNNQKNCKYVITSNFEKLRFYIDNAIDFEEFDLFKLTEERFAILYLCLYQENLLNDVPEKIKQASTVKEENVTKQLYKDYSEFKRKLFADIVHLNPQYDKLILFKKSQKLLDRILFILFAEDRNLIPANTIHTILNEWQQLQKLNVKIPLYDRFKNHFNYLNNGFKNDQYEIFGYNGGLFATDEILDNIIISDNLLQNYVPTLSKYDYETDVDVNILGHIFEHSLNDIDEIQAELNGTAIDKTKTKRKKDGVFYTPKYITKYIVENTIGALCNEKRNEFEIIEDNYTPDKRKAKKKELLQKLDSYQNWLLQITIVDPACGSGAFLNQALDFLIQEHKNIDELRAQLLGESLVLPDHEVAILENNIFGVDLNEESVEIARLSLWLRTARKGRKLNSLNNNIKCGNSLIDDVTIAGEKAFNWQKEFAKIFERGGFDVVIGNPPYVVYIKSVFGEQTLEFVNKNYKYSEYNPNTYALFTEIALNKLLVNNGKLGFIIPNTWLNNKYFSRMRYDLYSHFVNEIVYLKNTAFDEVVETIILLCANFKSNENEVLLKSNFDSNFIQHSAIQSSILKDGVNPFVTKENSIIEAIDKLSKIKNHAIVYRGLETKDNSIWLFDKKIDDNFKPILLGKDVNRYYTEYSGTYVNFIKKEMKSNANEAMYSKPKILMRRTGATIISDIDFGKLLALKNLYVILPNEINDIYTIQAQLNSKLLGYYHELKSTTENKAFAQFSGEYIANFPCLINANFEDSFKILIETMLQKNKELQTIKTNFIKVLQSQYATININTKLNNWNELSFKDFCAALEKQKIKITISEKAELLQYFETEQAKANNIQQIITQTDKEIDAMVYQLYELTDEEIKIIENEK